MDATITTTTTTTTVGTSTATTPIATTTTCKSNTPEQPSRPDIGLTLKVTVTPTDIITEQSSTSKDQEEIIDEEQVTSSTGSCFTCGGGGLLFGLPTKATTVDSTTGHREYIIFLTVDNNDTVTTPRPVDPNNTTNNNNKSTVTICQTQMRFSTFYERFSSPYEFRRNEKTASLLPRREWRFFEDYTYDHSNVTRRASCMQCYLLQLLNRSGIDILDSANLRTALDIAPEEVGSQLLHKIANLHRNEKARIVEEERQKLEAANKALEERKRKNWEASVARWKRAQDLDMSKAETRTSLKFNVAEKFVFRYAWFSCGGDGDIRDSGAAVGNRGGSGKPWFVLKSISGMGLFSNTMTYELRTTRENGGGRRPLLEIQERFRMFDYLCDLYYIIGDSNNRRRVKAATVHRERQIGFFGTSYTITVPSASSSNKNSNGNNPGPTTVFVYWFIWRHAHS